MTPDGADRLLAFELGGGLYALPIMDVAEVTDVPDIAAVPMLSSEIGGVVNYHGDALPVVYGRALLELDQECPHHHLLVLAKDLDDPKRYGLPVDHIHGLIDGQPGRNRTPGSVICERRPHGERLMSVLDPEELFERAASMIELSMAPHGPS